MLMFLALTLLLAGCCTRVDPTTQQSSKSFSNCLAATQQLMCSPTAAQQAEATSVLNFLQSGVAIASIFVPVPVTAAEVQLVFTAVQNGSCVLTTDLQQAADWYNALTAILKNQPAAAAKAGLKTGALPPPIPNINHWLNPARA